MGFRQHSPKSIEEFWDEVDSIERNNRGNIPFPVRTVEELDAGIPTDMALDLAEWDAIDAAGHRARKATVTAPPKDNVNLPQHYARYKIEPIQFLMENKVDPFQFNVVKYVLRHDAKNGLEDIKKVLRYAEMYLKFLSGDKDWWKPSTMVIPEYFP